MKELLKNGGLLFLKLLVTNIMCIFLVMSFTMIFNGIFTESIGYYALGTSSENEESVELYQHYYENGEDTKRAEYEAQGYTVSEMEIRSDLSKGQSASLYIITQLFCFLLMSSLVYPNIWHMGAKDSNLVKFKHKKEDLFKGLKIGAIAVLPMVLGLLFLAITPIKFATHFPLSIYSLCNSSLHSLISVITAGKSVMGKITVLQTVLLVLIQFIPALISALAYFLGAKNISVAEKFIYKKNKTGKD